MAMLWCVLIAVAVTSPGPIRATFRDHMSKTLYPHNHNNIYYSALTPPQQAGGAGGAVPLPYASASSNGAAGFIQPGSGSYYPATASTYGQPGAASANIVQQNSAPAVAPAVAPATVTVEFDETPSASASSAPITPAVISSSSATTSYTATSALPPVPASVTVDLAEVPSAGADPAQQATSVLSAPTTIKFSQPGQATPLAPASAQFNIADQTKSISLNQPNAPSPISLYTQVSSDPSQTVTIVRPSDISSQQPYAYTQTSGILGPSLTIDFNPSAAGSVQQSTAYNQQIYAPTYSLNRPGSFLSQQSGQIVQPTIYPVNQGRPHPFSTYTQPGGPSPNIPSSPTIFQNRPPSQPSFNVQTGSSSFNQLFGPTLNNRPDITLYVGPSGAVYLIDQNGNLIPTHQYAPASTPISNTYNVRLQSHVGTMHPLTADDLKSDLKTNPSAVSAQGDGSASNNFKINDMTQLRPTTYLGPVSNPLKYTAEFSPVRLSISTGRASDGDGSIHDPQQSIDHQHQNPQLHTAQPNPNEAPSGQRAENTAPQTVLPDGQQALIDEEISRIQQRLNKKAQEAVVLKTKMGSFTGQTSASDNPQPGNGIVLSSSPSGGRSAYNQMSRGSDANAPAQQADPMVGNPQAIIQGLKRLSELGLGDIVVFSPPGYAESLRATGQPDI